jgi:adenylyltransferase/sulfurtransferase
MGDVIKVGDAVQEDGRFSRHALIEWWDQTRLALSNVLVIGAGALGNEILKNLALLGVGRVFVADMDRIEHSNLARSVLFRDDDIGQYKASTAAARMKDIYPDARVRAFDGNIVHDLGLGVYRWADAVVCGLDNREARVAVNESCLRVGRVWTDGAIERLDGVARVFKPDGGACYECTMNETDWQMLEARRSCALLSRDEMLQGHTPTTATISSIIAGFQCQELLKHLHGIDVAGARGIAVNGQTNEVYAVEYPRREDCLAHETLEEIIELPERSDGISIGDLLARVREDLGPEAVLDLSREVLHEIECIPCGTREAVFESLGRMTEARGRCPRCGEMRAPHLLHSIDGHEDFLDRTPRELGLPLFDILVGRAGDRSRSYLLAGDGPEVMGELADATEPE